MLTITMKDAPSDSIPEVWGEKLDKMEAAVKNSDHDGMKARWKMGQELAKQRQGKKKMPNKLLDAVAKRIGVGREELRKRVRFADRYPTVEELGNAITQFPTWYRMVKDGLGLGKPKKKKKVATVGGPAEQLTKGTQLLISALRALSHTPMIETHLNCLRNLRDEIESVLADAASTDSN